MARSRYIREVARERMMLLYKYSLEEARRGDLGLARRYIEIMLRIAGKAGVRPPKYIRRGYCRRCHTPLIPGLTLSVRIRGRGKGSRVVYRCLECGWTRRFMIKASGRGSRRE
ncbi:ribonuclease P protein component 4 [Desulfurococcus mucosus]|uniref:Ribonuclease P protein component 4 n=1 Tax=Desulfurococcus mucosus (strain ATCC 35584 / DSM 2162 / JCM 9187 / O7/1) TaxID=765177 RepID=E8RAB8_DESM0|nr:ribonuclease P Rpr2/Rpp21/SNM1 subunit [Desulfurococcus mucosus]ADV65424.1 RNAse P, Rpr2/Rpp21 subunit [Desulfurococcus mucosus DSM 2162]